MKAETRDAILYVCVWILISLIVLTSSGCVTKRRCERKFPPIVEKETIIKDTTIITERTSFDTIFQVTHELSRDTIYFTDHETQVKIKYLQLPGDSVYLSAECPPDTVTVTKSITNITEQRYQWSAWEDVRRGLILGVVLLILYLVGRFLYKIGKRYVGLH